MTVTTAGEFGIGTITPLTKLEVSANNVGALVVSTRYQTSNSAPAGFGGRKASGTQASPTQVLATDEISAHAAIGYHSGGAFATASTGASVFVASENFTATAQGTYWKVGTTAIGTTTKVDHLFLTDGGNVGIGTASPASKLHIQSSGYLGGIEVGATDAPTVTLRGATLPQIVFTNVAGTVTPLEIWGIPGGGGLLKIEDNFAWRNRTNNVEFAKVSFVDTKPAWVFGSHLGTIVDSDTRFKIVGHNTATTDYALRVFDSSIANLLSVRNDGKVDLKDFSFQATGGIAYYDVTTYNTTKFRNTAISTDWMTFHVANVDITLHKKTNIIATYTPSNQETLEIGVNTTGTHIGISSVGVGNIMLQGSASGLGMPAIGRQGGYLTGTSATMRFSYDPVSFGDIPTSLDPNNYRIGIGVNTVSGYRVNIADGLQVSSSPASPTGTAINVSEGSVVINELSGTGIRTVNVDESGTLIVGIASGSITSKYAGTFTPGTPGIANTITHGIGTTDISVTLWDVTAGDIIYARIDNRTTTQVDVTFDSGINPAGNVRVVVIG
jgi:hypothetical protein